MLDHKISICEVKHVIKGIKNNKTAESDGIVGELIKYGGKGMCKMLFDLVWSNGTVPGPWNVGLIVSLFKNGDKQDPGNYRGITLLNVVDKLYII